VIVDKALEPVEEAAQTEEVSAGTETSVEAPAIPGPVSQAYWLLSLFAPTSGESIEWKCGYYSLVERGGRVDSPARSGDLKKSQNMVAEGSVLFSAGDPRGSAADVAPDGFPHPVYRAGFAVAIPIPQAQP
jgi:CRISPR type III-A-associated RAMP protein Csm4